MSNDIDYTHDERNLATYLNVLAALFVAFGLAVLILPYALRDAPFFVAPPFFVTNTIAGMWLMAYLSWCSAADVRRYRAMIVVVFGGLLIGAASFVALAVRTGPPLQDAPLLIGFGFCGAAVLGLAWFVRKAQMPAPPWLPWITDKPMTGAETFARVVFGLFGLASLFAAAGSVLASYLNVALMTDLLVNPFMIVGSTIKIGVLGLCSLYAAYDPRRFSQHAQMIIALVVGHAGSIIAISIVALSGYVPFGDYSLTVGGATAGLGVIMFGAWLLDVVIIIAFLYFNRRINLALLDHIGFLNPTQFRALEAIAETLVAGKTHERVPPHEIVLRTDSYMRSFRSNRLGLAKLAMMGLQLSPLAWLSPPITYMHPAARARFVDFRFKQQIVDRSALYRFFDGLVRNVNKVLLRFTGRSGSELDAALSFTGLLEAMMRFNMQLTYLGYYNNPEVWPKHEDGSGIGYTPFSQREKNFEVKPIRAHPPLKVMTPEVLDQEGIDVIDDADVVIVGSGPGGAILAEQLLEKGRRVLILEKGLYVHPDDFNEDEVDMISRLYSDGALQISQSLRFTILQGSAVGGTSVVNNAVCFDTPQRVIDTWNARSNNGKVIDDASYFDSQQKVRARMRIKKIAEGTRKPLDAVLNHGDSLITSAVKQYFAGREDAYEYDVVEANIVDCLGCGYCNIGCKYGRKLSMLDEVLPAAQHKHGAENMRIISEANVTKLTESSGKITEVHAEVAGKRKLLVRNPKTVVVSGGTIHSSWLLMQSGIGKAAKLPVGKGLSFNMGSPLHALFNQKINAYDGLQIAHYLKVHDHPGFVYETWYNPPVAQALTMPGWLDTHFRNMQNYDRIAAVGVLVGTESNAHIVPALISGGPDVVFQPTQGDLTKLVDALVMLGNIFFTGGALEVYATTRRYQPYVNESAVLRAQSQVDALRDLVKHDYDILLGTGHPQGGNAIGASPTDSVIGPDFKVFGYSNLYVCDASVFPTSTTVNPQLTVMTLAHYAAQFVQ